MSKNHPFILYDLHYEGAISILENMMEEVLSKNYEFSMVSILAFLLLKYSKVVNPEF